jgi:hypothetical protein
MYKTTRKMAGGTLMICKDCGHSLSMNRICEKPIQSATNMLKHMAAHNASRAFAQVESVIRPERGVVPILELARALGVPMQMDRCGSRITQASSLPLRGPSTEYSSDQLRLSEALLIM